MTGREFFDEHKENAKKCKLLQKMEEEALESWEDQKVSEFSPGVVLDEELLYQQVVDPTHIAPNGQGLDPMAFDVCRSHGLSTQRVAHTNIDELIASGEDRANNFNLKNPDKKQKKLWGFIPYTVSEIREVLCLDTETRPLYVFDTADEDNIPHAEICQGGLNSSSKAQWVDLRTRLYLMAKRKLISIEQMKAKAED
ncbi:hypothetical protein ACHAC9_22155 [Massilia sp. CMS3.1]|uniref:hypothetical protein n=1 Tax=Massilia sp. CMS3.1 TaxID=3373083 RepID=UPI003EE46D96